MLSRLRESEDWPRVDAIVVSHFHLDHSGDLVPWLWGHLMGPVVGTNGPDLWLPPAGQDWFATFAAQFGGTFAVSEYAERTPFHAAGFAVTPFRVPHYTQPAWALRVEAGGRVLAYSGDSAPAPALADAARGADLFLCEATLDGPDDEPRGHLRPDEAVAAAQAAGAKRLLLTHRPAELAAPDGLELARDGLVVAV